jgi:hypothetical protein
MIGGVKEMSQKEEENPIVIGATFGELTVIGFLPRDKNNHKMVKCQCSCGKTTHTRVTRIVNGSSRSCGHVARALVQRLYDQPKVHLEPEVYYKRGGNRQALPREGTAAYDSFRINQILNRKP